MGAVIAFESRPAPAPRAGKPNPYAFLEAEARRYFTAARIKEAQPPAQPAAEDEILTLLRRIDRRLAKLAKALPIDSN